MSSPAKVQSDSVATKSIAQAQAQLAKLEAEAAQEKTQLQAVQAKQTASDAKIDAEEKANPKDKKQLEAERSKDDAAFKKQEQSLSSKLHEGSTQAAGIQAKLTALLKEEQGAQDRGFHWAPQITEMAKADESKLSGDEKKLAAQKKEDVQVTKQINSQIDAMEKKDPSHKAKYEALRQQLKGEAAQAEAPTAAKVKADKANVKELQTELDARAKWVKTTTAAGQKAITTKYDAKEKADAGSSKKLAADKAAEKKAMAAAQLNAKNLALRGKEAQTAVTDAEKGKAVAKWTNPKAKAPQTPGSNSESWKKGPGELKGADTSGWQSNAEFQASIKGAKWSAVKATQGTGYTDPTFAGRWKELGKLVNDGKMKLRMAYCFLNAGESGKAQADHFLAATGIHGKMPAGTRLVLDWEGSAFSDPGALKDAAARIHQVTGLWPVVYVQGSMMSTAEKIVPQAPIWEAAYGSGINKNVPFMQYSDGPGYDHDTFNGNLAALEKFAGWKA